MVCCFFKDISDWKAGGGGGRGQQGGGFLLRAAIPSCRQGAHKLTSLRYQVIWGTHEHQIDYFLAHVVHYMLPVLF